MGEVLWVYWAQSVMIGVVNYHRMRSLKDFSTKGLMFNGKPVLETRKAQISTAIFFAMHYGFFHLFYLFFLITLSVVSNESGGNSGNALMIALCIASFIAAHLYSFRHNSQRDFKDKKPNIGTLLFFPYMRVVPMHIAIILGFAMQDLTIYIFMVLKTFSDVGMHIVEHRLFQKPK